MTDDRAQSAEEIVRALLKACEDCSERNGHGGCDAIYYCANKHAADLIKAQAAEIAELRGQLDAETELRRRYEKQALRNAVAYDEKCDELTASQQETRAIRNELCLKCGRYHEAHKGACDGCRWKEIAK